MIHSRHRLQFVLRVFVLGLLALGMALMPVFASLGDLHELGHDQSGSHGLATHAAHHEPTGDLHNDGEADAEGEEGQGSDALHALLHFAHCCGQQSLNASALMPLLAPLASSTALLMPEEQVLPRSSALAPFRPPITI